MPHRFKNISMCLSTTYHCMGDSKNGRLHAIPNVGDLIEDPHSETGLTALAHTELALGMLMNGEYESARRLTYRARQVLKKTPEFENGEYWHIWADYTYAWSLIGTGDAGKAADALNAMLAWFKKPKKYPYSETEARRYVLAPRL